MSCEDRRHFHCDASGCDAEQSAVAPFDRPNGWARFELDGVVFDACAVHTEAIHRALFGGPRRKSGATFAGPYR